MKKIYLLLLLHAALNKSFSQTERCNLSNIICNSSLKDSIFRVTESPKIPYDSAHGAVKYKDVNYKLDCCSQTCPPTYCAANADSTLYYRVFYPNNYSSYLTCPLPAVIMFHAGSYSECSSAELKAIVAI